MSGFGLPGGFGFLMGGGGGPEIPEEVIENRPEGMDKETAVRLYTNARGDGYFDRGISDKLPVDQDVIDIYNQGFAAGEWSRKVDIANGIEITDPRDDEKPKFVKFEDAPIHLKVKHVLESHPQLVAAASIASVSASASLLMLKKAIVD